MTTLYHTNRTDWLDPWGDKHSVDQILERVNVLRAGTFPVDNGYEVYHSLTSVSADGRTFVKRVPIDFGGQAFWYEAVTKTFWYERLPRRLLDENGQPVLPA